MANNVGGPIRDARDMPFDAAGARLCHTGGRAPFASTDGTDTTPVITETYIAELYMPARMSVTGFGLFNGSAVAGNVKAILYDAAGNVVASSASTAQSGTDAYQRLPFSAVQILPPGKYYIGVQCGNTGARINTHPFGNFGASKKTGEVYGTATAITPPTTFTTALGPMGGLY